MRVVDEPTARTPLTQLDSIVGDGDRFVSRVPDLDLNEVVTVKLLVIVDRNDVRTINLHLAP